MPGSARAKPRAMASASASSASAGVDPARVKASPRRTCSSSTWSAVASVPATRPSKAGTPLSDWPKWLGNRAADRSATMPAMASREGIGRTRPPCRMLCVSSRDRRSAATTPSTS